MKKIFIMGIVMLLLTGCTSKEEIVEVAQEALSEVTISDTTIASKESEEMEITSSENIEETIEISESQAETENLQTEGNTEVFDATQAVSLEVIEEGIRVTFRQLPQNASDMQAIIDIYSQKDARSVCAFFHAALVRYPNSPEDCFAMLDVLRGPQPLSDAEKAFIKERLSDKLYLPRAYFEGAVPKNEYQPAEPWTIIIYDDPVTPPEGYAYTMVKTSGADSSRRIVMRIKDGLNYLWEYNAALLSIRLPASEDPWV